MKVLVTGGAGFIGSHVVDELNGRGYEPIIFDHRKERLVSGNVFIGDVRDAVSVSEAMHHAEGFIHLAAALGTQETIFDPRPAVETNIFGGLNILEAAAKYDVPGVNIAVGNWWMANPYAITKNSIERFIDMYNQYRGTRINNVRAMNAYGPRQVAAAPYGPSKVRKITPSFVCRALNNDPIEVYGDGQQVSDMVYVSDVAKALVSAMENARDGNVHDTVEVGPAIHNTVKEFADEVIRQTGSKSEIVHLPMRPGEEPNASVTADISTLSYVGMNPDELVSIEKGLAETIEYFVRLNRAAA